MIEKIKQEFLKNQDKKYKNFSTSLLPGIDNVIGVRLPVLRKLAKNIAKNDYQIFLNQNDDEFLELTMLEGMIIGEIEKDFDCVLNLVENFIPKINCWSVCDSFCSSLKIIKKNQAKTKLFLEKYFNSNKEYEIRFAYVILLDYFIEQDYSYVMDKISKFNHEAYYSKMAAAWCLSICLIKNFSRCIEDIQNLKIHPWVLNKGITKAIESLRLSKKQKEELKKIKTLIKSKK